MPTKPLDALLDPGYVEDVRSLTLVELRQRRGECHEAEVGLSYLRRLVQGRLDIALSELHRREVHGEPMDAAALIERLPEILADRVRGPGTGRLPMLMAPGEVDEELLARVDGIASAERLIGLSELDEADVRQTIEDLEFYEHALSAQRRDLHAVIDQLQEEIVRRYKTGEATVDGLLAP
jgi:hypothetical protein